MFELYWYLNTYNFQIKLEPLTTSISRQPALPQAHQHQPALTQAHQYLSFSPELGCVDLSLFHGSGISSNSPHPVVPGAGGQAVSEPYNQLYVSSLEGIGGVHREVRLQDVGGGIDSTTGAVNMWLNIQFISGSNFFLQNVMDGGQC